jgi:hypothetical protein
MEYIEDEDTIQTIERIYEFNLSQEIKEFEEYYKIYHDIPKAKKLYRYRLGIQTDKIRARSDRAKLKEIKIIRKDREIIEKNGRMKKKLELKKMKERIERKLELKKKMERIERKLELKKNRHEYLRK